VTTVEVESDNAINDDLPCHTPCHSRHTHDKGPVWKDCLEEVKLECRAMHVLSNPWLKLKVDSDSLTDSLTTMVMEWTWRGIHFKPSEYLLNMGYLNNIIFQAVGQRSKQQWYRWYVIHLCLGCVDSIFFSFMKTC